MINSRTIAILSLTVLFFLLIWNIIPIIQVKMQLVNDFIPNSVLYEVAKPFIYISITLITINLISFLLFFQKKYIAVVCLGCISFCLHQLYILLL